MTSTEQDSNGDGILKQRIYEQIAVIFAGKDLSHEQIAALMDDRKESVELIMKLITADRKRVALEARIGPFEFVEPCEPDCDDVRHAYHQGQWDMATRIEAQQEEL